MCLALLGGEFIALFAAAVFNNALPRLGVHAGTKAVGALSFSAVSFERAFWHRIIALFVLGGIVTKSS